jgi:hypothetical protein
MYYNDLIDESEKLEKKTIYQVFILKENINFSAIIMHLMAD